MMVIENYLRDATLTPSDGISIALLGRSVQNGYSALD